MDQMPSNAPIMESKPGVAGWFQVWTKVFTKPSEQTFVEITEGPEAVARTAYIWVFIAGTISGIIQAILRAIYAAMGMTPQLPIPGLEEYIPQTTTGDPGTTVTALVSGICGAPLAGLVSVLFFAIGVAIVQWVAKLFGGTGSYEKLAYAVGAISLPLTIVTSILSLFSAIPFVGICTGVISFGFAIFAIYLQIAAVKAVNRFGWGQAAGSVLIPWLVIVFVCGCLVFGGLLLLGPVIGNVFGEINQGLAP
ncbi:MAG: YIP1 family protein [Anaerolineales bacterium]|nr:YIP1 family protein [Anaerolineales bacterium]